MNAKDILKGTYKASDCTDVRDCEIAIEEIFRAYRERKMPSALQMRLASLRKKKQKLNEKNK